MKTHQKLQIYMLQLHKQNGQNQGIGRQRHIPRHAHIGWLFFFKCIYVYPLCLDGILRHYPQNEPTSTWR